MGEILASPGIDAHMNTAAAEKQNSKTETVANLVSGQMYLVTVLKVIKG